MRFGPRRFWRWQLSAGVIAPAVALLVLTAIGATAFVAWSTNRIDERMLERETALVERGVAAKLAELPTAQESIAIWDDALVQATRIRDKDWLDDNLGVWMYEFYGIEATAVVSGAGELVYTMLEGTSPAPRNLVEFEPAFTSLIAQLRNDLAAGALDTYAEGGPYPRVQDVVSLGGHPATISVMPITPSSERVEPSPPGAEYLHVAVDYLDDEFAQALHDGYQLDDVGFAQAVPSGADRAAFPIFDRGGRLITMFEWSPERPGREMLAQTMPVMGVAFLMAAVLVTLLARRLWASSAALEKERLEARHQSLHDHLTGLPNRVQFETHLGRDLKRQRPSVPTALLMLDLDRFKHINDTFGHEAGDRLVCAVGQRLRELVGPADIVARLGGDEFAVIHPCREADVSPRDLAGMIVEAMAKPFEVNGSEAFVGASIGVAIADRADAPNDLIRKADISLFEAKARGRGRAQQYEPSMGALLQDRHQLELDLREALKHDGQISVAFQPQISAGGHLVGIEALARWTHPTLGPISPARFVPVAESSGLIEQLGELVLQQACQFGARWPGRRVAVNISPVQLGNPRFPERVFDLMIETVMRPSDLELEITEGILLDNDGPALEAINMFRRAGIRIALDDFGTGYSSLNYLKRYPVDCIKIDRSFVAQLAPSNSSAAIVQAMVTLAHALDIEVTAEGVETHEQLTILKAMGCNLFQGFLLGPPTSAELLEEKLRHLEHGKGITQAA